MTGDQPGQGGKVTALSRDPMGRGVEEENEKERRKKGNTMKDREWKWVEKESSPGWPLLTKS